MNEMESSNRATTESQNREKEQQRECGHRPRQRLKAAAQGMKSTQSVVTSAVSCQRQRTNPGSKKQAVVSWTAGFSYPDLKRHGNGRKRKQRQQTYNLRVLCRLLDNTPKTNSFSLGFLVSEASFSLVAGSPHMIYDSLAILIYAPSCREANREQRSKVAR